MVPNVGKMSEYENVVTGKLKLKGKALDVKTGGLKKKVKKKKNLEYHEEDNTLSATNLTDPSSDLAEKTSDMNDHQSGESHRGSSYVDSLTPAEKKYIEQKEKIDVKRLAKTANKSHRDRIEDFNQYLANMSEHYDIPKVGPG